MYKKLLLLLLLTNAYALLIAMNTNLNSYQSTRVNCLQMLSIFFNQWTVMVTDESSLAEGQSIFPNKFSNAVFIDDAIKNNGNIAYCAIAKLYKNNTLCYFGLTDNYLSNYPLEIRSASNAELQHIKKFYPKTQ